MLDALAILRVADLHGLEVEILERNANHDLGLPSPMTKPPTPPRGRIGDNLDLVASSEVQIHVERSYQVASLDCRNAAIHDRGICFVHTDYVPVLCGSHRTNCVRSSCAGCT